MCVCVCVGGMRGGWWEGGKGVSKTIQLFLKMKKQKIAFTPKCTFTIMRNIVLILSLTHIHIMAATAATAESSIFS